MSKSFPASSAETVDFGCASEQTLWKRSLNMVVMSKNMERFIAEKGLHGEAAGGFEVSSKSPRLNGDLTPRNERDSFVGLCGDMSASKNWIGRQIDKLLRVAVPPKTSRDITGTNKPVKGSFGNVSLEAMALTTLDAIGDAVLVVDPDGKVIYLNKVAETLTGWPEAEALGRSVDQVFHIVDGVSRQQATSPAHRAISAGQTVGLALGSVLIRRDGSDIAIEDSAAPIRDGAGGLTGAVIVFHDARQSGHVTQKMSHLAQHDCLTGLPNRMLLMDRLTNAIGMAKRHGKKMALVFLDLDGFKQINDSFGHAVGDHLLRDVAADIESCVRDTDTVSRHGGDEFVVLLTEIERRRDATHIAEKLLDKFAQPHMVEGQELDVTVSIGISVYPEDGIDADTLMRRADNAMYCAKNAGRNTYRFCQLA